MRAVDVFKMPLYAAELATGAKSFWKNPLIGSKRLNEAGLHLARIKLADGLANYRRSRLSHLVSEDDQAAYSRDGYLQKSNHLPPEELGELRKEIERTYFDAWDMRQGNAVTRFIPLQPSVLDKLPRLRSFVWSQPFQNSLRYIASTNGDPLVYLHIVMTDPNDGRGSDPQTLFHSDTFHQTAKAWFFLYDIHDEDGPFTFIPGSHRLSPERLQWEYEKSISAATAENRHHAGGSFRLLPDELPRLKFREPIRFNVSANTLLVADTHGFHARAPSKRPSIRVGIYGSLRRNPFLPWTGLDFFNLPGMKGRQARLFLAQKDWETRRKGHSTHRYAGKILATEPSKF